MRGNAFSANTPNTGTESIDIIYSTDTYKTQLGVFFLGGGGGGGILRI